jgi:hypothetical protein
MHQENPQNRDQQADVMPSTAVAAVGIGWLLLFGIRSVVAPLLLFLDPTASARIADLDRGTLLRIYLILLSFMVLIAALRLARNAEARSKHKDKPGTDGGQRA